MDKSRDEKVLASIAFVGVGDVLVLCHSEADPSDAEWEAWLDRQRRREHRALLISTAGGAPNSRQRARVAQLAPHGPAQRPPVALLTDSAATRHVMTAFAWILGRHHAMKAFPRRGVSEAVSWLGAKSSLEDVRSAIERLHAALGSPVRKAGR